jgi:hypothetical protein
VNELKAELQRLYADSSKHSVYQNVPDFVSAELGYTETIDEGWRGDRPRLEFLSKFRAPIDGETWMDFGANTGFFTLSLAHDYPQAAFIAVEANPNHACFIERVAHNFELRNVQVIKRAVGLRELSTLPHSDFILHLNVLHHAGHDFDADLVPDRASFPKYAASYMQALRERASTMLFQMGFNWKGDIRRCLFEKGTKAEMIDFVSRGTGGTWKIEHIGVAERQPDGVRYADINDANVRRDDSLGEFLNRPLFIMHAR